MNYNKLIRILKLTNLISLIICVVVYIIFVAIPSPQLPMRQFCEKHNMTYLGMKSTRFCIIEENGTIIERNFIIYNWSEGEWKFLEVEI